MWILDQSSLRFLAVNAAAAARCGYRRSELLRMRFDDLVPGEDHAAIGRCLGRVTGRRGPATAGRAGVFRLVRKDGSVFLAEITWSRARVAGRSVVMSHLRDASEEAKLGPIPVRAPRAVLEHLEEIERLADPLGESLPDERSLREVLERVRLLSGADLATALVLLRNERGLKVKDRRGAGVRGPATVRVPIGRGIAGRIAAARRPLHAEDLSQVEVLDPVLEDRFGSLSGAPILLGGRLVGVLHVARRDHRPFVLRESDLLRRAADRMAPLVERVRLIGELRRERRRLRAVARRVAAAREEERRSIARELHDVMGQNLTGLKLMLESLERSGRGDGGPSWPPRGLVRQMRALVADLIRQTRVLSSSLRPDLLEERGLLPAIARHLRLYTSRTGIRVRLKQSGAERRFAPELEAAAFGIIQEALTNVARHSGARTARVEIAARGGRLRVLVADRGRGFAPDAIRPGSAAGLEGMRERALRAGGAFVVRAAPGAGSVVEAELPLGSPGRGRRLRDAAPSPAPTPRRPHPDPGIWSSGLRPPGKASVGVRQPLLSRVPGGCSPPHGGAGSRRR